MKHPRAIVFDLDNTLLDGRDFSKSLVQTCEALAAQHVGLTAENLLLANGDVWRAYWPEVEHDWTLGFLSGARVTEEAWRRALRACGCHDDAVVGVALEIHSRCARLTYRQFADARQLIASLKHRTRLALVTNGAADTQREKLQAMGMHADFEATAISGELGIAKPDPAIFHFALDQLGIAAADAWHVGDSLATDIAGAKSAGVTAIWLNRGNAVRQPTDPEPDLEISSLAELQLLLEHEPERASRCQDR